MISVYSLSALQKYSHSHFIFLKLSTTNFYVKDQHKAEGSIFKIGLYILPQAMQGDGKRVEEGALIRLKCLGWIQNPVQKD